LTQTPSVSQQSVKPQRYYSDNVDENDEKVKKNFNCFTLVKPSKLGDGVSTTGTDVPWLTGCSQYE